MTNAVLEETERLADAFESGDYETDDLVAIAGQARVFVNTVRQLTKERDEAQAARDKMQYELSRAQVDVSMGRTHCRMCLTERVEAGVSLYRVDHPHAPFCSLYDAPREPLPVREAARRRRWLDGADAQALEGALAMTERERDVVRAEVERLQEQVDWLLEGRQQEEQRRALEEP